MAIDLLLAVALSAVGLSLIRFAFRVARYDKIEYQKSRARYPSLLAAISGKATVRHNGAPDGRVRAGIVYNTRKNRIEPNGKLRNDIVDQVI
ncbi:hypothetical protein [Rhizobium leguminosarum]|uniref:hypothetical protein n=1 Tax=Rhizobium leguminosarum TaxID=384 RepID=UPI001C915F99|nr:hypothetical protein [Rhizobium leguminosarum]MBY2969506.1 hypothetical protein [Rhizobium leguminosarum]MBY2976879.1 hypothetical protein [Rhizobium leguminosarum]MBY3005430.1 hypothetical protein [Rhizobium leguminosarum]